MIELVDRREMDRSFDNLSADELMVVAYRARRQKERLIDRLAAFFSKERKLTEKKKKDLMRSETRMIVFALLSNRIYCESDEKCKKQVTHKNIVINNKCNINTFNWSKRENMTQFKDNAEKNIEDNENNNSLDGFKRNKRAARSKSVYMFVI